MVMTTGNQPFGAHVRLIISFVHGLIMRDAPPLWWDQRRCFQYFCRTVAHDEEDCIKALETVRDFQALHEVTCVDLKNACPRTAELRRKATDAHERTRSHRERCRRATKEHTKSEAAINHNVKETANATHSLTCGVPDRESNETK